MSSKDLLRQSNWLFLNKTLINRLGLNAAALISEFCDKEEYFEKDGDWFYLSRERILEDIGLSPDAQRKAGDILIEANILEMKKQGLPARNYYKINEDVLLHWLISSDDDIQRQAVDISTTRDVNTQRQAEEISTPYKEHIYKTEYKEQNIKAPEPALSEILSETNNPRRNFRKEHEVLKDDLQSGKDIDSEKQKKKKSPAERTRDNCLDEINKRNYSEDTKELLREYYLWASSGTDVRKIKSFNLWCSKLDYLEQLIKQGEDARSVVQQSIDKQWYKFESVSKTPNIQQTSFEPLADKVIVTDEETRDREWAKKLESDEGWY